MSELHVGVDVPARNDAERLEACLAALAPRRDRRGAPLPTSLYALLVYADHRTDCTAGTVRAWADLPRQSARAEVTLRRLRRGE